MDNGELKIVYGNVLIVVTASKQVYLRKWGWRTSGKAVCLRIRNFVKELFEI